MTVVSPSAAAPATRLTGWDSIEFWVGNARAMAGFLSGAFGFTVTAYAGPETGRADRASYLLEQGRIRLVVTSGLTPESEIWNHVRAHGDGAHDLAFLVDDATATFEAAIRRAARRHPRRPDGDGNGSWTARNGQRTGPRALTAVTALLV